MKRIILVCGAVLCAGSFAAAQRVLVEDYRFGAFTQATSIEVDPFQHVYVSDQATSTITKFNLTGTALRTAGGKGWTLNQFDVPRGLDARLGVAIYAADMQNHRIVRLDKDLNVLGTFSSRNDPSAENTFGYPLDVVVSKLGNLLILDGENHRIVSSTGFATIDNTFGGVESGKGFLRQPVAMAIDGEDNLFVLEPERVVVFDGFSNYRFEFGTGRVTGARGIAVRGQTCVVVSGDVVHVFRTDGTWVSDYGSKECLFSAPADEFRDVALLDHTLLLLTPSSIIVAGVSF